MRLSESKIFLDQISNYGMFKTVNMQARLSEQCRYFPSARVSCKPQLTQEPPTCAYEHLRKVTESIGHVKQ